jgi:hypothetical protein
VGERAGENDFPKAVTQPGADSFLPFGRYILKGCRSYRQMPRPKENSGTKNIMSTQTIKVHLPDESIREVPSGTTPLDIANSISPRLAAASVVARLTPPGGTTAKATSGEEPSEAAMYAAEDSAAPRLVDLATPLTADTRLELVTEKDPEAL